MRLFYFSICLGLFSVQLITAQTPTPSAGRCVRHADFASQHVAARHVDVWLPSDYDGRKPYSVLYMHDGQMLFDTTHTWNHKEWQVDEWLSGQHPDWRKCIVVGVWNSGTTRHSDYFPQKPFESLTEVQKQAIFTAARANGMPVFSDYKIQSDAYLRFLVSELKPFIDATYATRKGRSDTFVMGSSMGGLISMYAICEYPDVFGGAACLSTHWPGIFQMEGNPVPDAFLAYLQAHLPNPRKHRIWFDYGDQTLDALYPPLQKRADDVMRKRGFSKKNWVTRFYPGADHSEAAWAKRLSEPLDFLLRK